jgi:hypothetical protein
MWKRICAGLLVIALCGCLKTKDEVSLNADGSGKVHLETVSSIPPELVESLNMSGGTFDPPYPPVSEADARKYFPEKDFHVSVKQEHAANGDLTTIIDADFKDINALLASPYGKAHQLMVKVEGGSLIVKGVGGMERVARLADMKEDPTMGMGMMPGTEDLKKRKGEMRDEFRITLPNPLSNGNGANAGKTAAWIVERAQCKDGDEFAQKLGAVFEARCNAAGIKFTPLTPLRLALQPFADLPAGASSTAGPAIDTNKISAAIKFVPYGLKVTRSLDLSGEGGGRESQAELIGAVVAPAEFIPQKWGVTKLDEATDDKGNDLKPKNPDQSRDFSMNVSSFGDDDDEDAATNNLAGQRRIVSLTFRPPDWKVTGIARIKGFATLQYFGGSPVVVKLTNAIPASWIMDPSKMMSGSFDASPKNLDSHALNDLGLSVSVNTGMTQNGMTILALQVNGKTATLTDAQVFDADGKPWPTMFSPQGSGEEESFQVLVTGNPHPPLSLALLATGGGTVVEAPILVEHVSLNQK